MLINDISRLLLYDLLVNQNAAERNNSLKQIKISGRDTLEISSTAKNMSITNKVSGTSRNRKIDQSIDLQSYIEKSKKGEPKRNRKRRKRDKGK